MKPGYILGKKKGSQTKVSMAIYSAALQDHFLKKFTSSIDIDFSKKREQQKRKTFKKLPSLSNKTTKMEQKIHNLQNQNKRSILPYEDIFLKKIKQQKSDFQKMKKYNKKLTWAQKLGIVEAPPLPLSSNDWQKIQEKSKVRNDSQSICSICLEDFKIQPQVILSCSHVFHLKCLTSYQNHNKIKCCPICRHKNYEKKVIDEALRAFTLKSIVLIQKTFRGSQDRISLYTRLFQLNYKASSVRFNRRMVGFKMWRLSRRITDKIRKDNWKFQETIQGLRSKNQKDNNDILRQMIEIQRKKITDSNQIQKYLTQFGIKPKNKAQIENCQWQNKLKTAVQRKDQQCSICLNKLHSKPIYLLSCTHMFHVSCIQSFQRYAIPGNQNKCPCCRSGYAKKLLNTNKYQ